MVSADDRISILYLAPWLDIGGSDKGTLDWFRFLDRDRFHASLITTQPAPNRQIRDVLPYAEEVWDLPDLMPGNEFARFIVTFIVTRQVQVVHVMNSRLGFELLPEIAALPERPRVVVQLHVEEPDCSGYVRYVTTRYGNLVDAFSVSSDALSARVARYHIPRGKRRTIYTGVDGQHEFAPSQVRPVEGLEPGFLHILFPARLVPQKDPLLMVEVAARLRQRGVRFRVHVLGDGALRPALGERIRATGLEQEVILHGERVEVAPWYAACQLVLLTSEFEGVPYVVYEAMAMATPLVAPELPGMGELVGPDTGVLVSPRDDAEAYAAALMALGDDPGRRSAMGSAGRERALAEFSLERMAGEHGALYDELVGVRPPGGSVKSGPEAGSVNGSSRPGDPGPVSSTAVASVPIVQGLRNRRPGAAPLVSVIVPCFDDGHFLPACLESITGQDYAQLETIVVDNGSTDPETLETFTRIEREGDVRVLRVPVNRGPSPARNAALEVAGGRYVLPVDADNILLPGAVAALVAQLAGAGEQIGFIYPNFQFFGNRDDYYEPPSYNLHALLDANYCDTCSLIDGEIFFERGFRYPEKIILGYEDWDLVLTLAEHGIYGEPARSKTLLFRKHGFTRSDLVAAASVPFSEVMQRRHPRLYGSRPGIKGEYSPAVSVILLDPLEESRGDALSNLVRAALEQRCQDFEVLVRSEAEIWPTMLGRRLRRIPRLLAASRAEALDQGVQSARGRYVLAGYGSAATLLDDPTLIEKLLRAQQVNPQIEALALAEGTGRLAPLRLLSPEEIDDVQLGALCWTTIKPGLLPASFPLPGPGPLEAIARWLSAQGAVQWRHLPRPDRRSLIAAVPGPDAVLGLPRLARARDAHHRAAEALLPGLPPGVAPRLQWPAVWMPPQARVLCRHLDHQTGRYVHTNDRTPPPGCSLQYELGSVRHYPLAGTVSLQTREDGFAVDQLADLDAPELLGFVEQAPLPLFDALQVGRHRETGQEVLIAGSDDPLAGEVQAVEFIGFIEPFPVHPRRAPHAEFNYGLIGLHRTVDLQARRHRYGVGQIPVGRPAGELGALFTQPTGDSRPLWVDDEGRVLLPGPTHSGRPSLATVARWSGAPLTWHRLGSPGPKVRAAARRSLLSARILASPRGGSPRPPHGDAAGYLLQTPTPRTVPLFCAIHPVTGDQLLSTDENESAALGYRHAMPLGHLVARAPTTGRLGVLPTGIPWASRFGLARGGQ